MIWNYKNARVVIVGLGVTGFSCLNFFLNRGVIPKVIDSCRFLSAAMHKLSKFVPSHFGELHDEWLLNATLIVVSPGVRLDHPIFLEAVRLGIEIVGDIELFVREVNAPIIAITGSNGKSTVTKLVGEIAQNFGLRVGIAGNIGIPVLTLLDRYYQLYVLEISSFQLDTTYSLRAAVAIVLNVSEDHMDRYIGGFQEYCASKRKIYQNATICVVNAAQFLVQPDSSITHCVSFGVNVESADYHLNYYKGNYWIIAHNKRILNCSNMKIQNYVSYANFLAVLAISDIIKIPRKVSCMVLCQFSGLKHRFQLIHKNRGVKWINDSKATNVLATKEAINSLIGLGKLHLLLGGYAKLADFSFLKKIICSNDIDLYCFGKEGPNLTELGNNSVILTNTMHKAIYIISRRVKRKEIVLLSPACSSLDQFTSFAARGLVFAYLARKFG